MNREDVKKAIIEKEKILHAYETGEIKSKVYTDEEIKEKEEYYLYLKPEKESGLNVGRWQVEVRRQIERNENFKDCPDKYFYHLDTFRKWGM